MSTQILLNDCTATLRTCMGEVRAGTHTPQELAAVLDLDIDLLTITVLGLTNFENGEKTGKGDSKLRRL